MINCVIIEDEPKAKNVLERYIEKLNDITLIGYCKDGIDAIDELPKLNPDLIFLDINMPNLNGIELLKLLTKKPKIIITTAYSEYALESYDFDVLDYLLKPISFEKFLRAINRYKSSLSEIVDLQNEIQYDSQYTLIKSGSKTHKLRLDDILYLKKDGNYLEIYTAKEKIILIRSSMNDVFKLIPETSFIRIHKSYVVPLDKIDILEVNKITIGKHKIPIGAIYREELNSRLKKDSF
ncbi:response regulator [Flavobacteriaceae bacterium AU392]|nr:DNA-binding response regulator [Flavobacteriaceae bacterium]RKM85998.1 response regulator [Flavobacteriaceae bacterium AU392]